MADPDAFAQRLIRGPCIASLAGARVSLAVPGRRPGVPEIVPFMTAGDLPSRRVMVRPGVRDDPADDLDHPSLDAAGLLCRHVLHRLAGTDLA